MLPGSTALLVHLLYMETRETDMRTPPTWYAIRVEGCLTSQWAEWFEGLSLIQENGETFITGPVPDQAALFGLLKKVRDLGLPLVSVNRILGEETQPTNPNKE